MRGSAVDTGGLEVMTSAATVRVDCTAPMVTIDGGATDVLEGEVVEPPAVEVEDITSGVATTDVEVSVDGGGWVAVASPVVAEAERSYVFRARAQDVAGNWSAWRISDPVFGRAAPQPQPEPEPTSGPQPHVGPTEPAVAPAPVEALIAPPEASAPTAEPLPVVPATRPTVAAPRVRFSRVRRRGRVVEVAGVAARDLTTTARVTLRAGRTIRRRTITIEKGRWRARFRIPKARRPHTITVVTQPTATHAAATARWRAPRTSLHPLR